MDLVLTAPQVVAEDRLLAPGTVIVRGGRITDVRAGRPGASVPHVALDGGTLGPGLVDLQVNGFAGIDFSTADPAAVRTAAAAIARTGVTAFLPTLVTAPVDELAAAVGRLAAAREELTGTATAQPFGVHVEGPFLSATHPGAHNPRWLRDPDPDAVAAIVDGAPGAVRILTLAPERAGALEAIAALAERGVVVSIGHSDATAAQVRAALHAGARKVTHLFNAQRGLHHREPGVVGVALTDPRVTSGLIADLHHVAPEAGRIALAAAPGRLLLVTDAAAAAGMPPGSYTLGGTPIEQPADGPPLRPDGTIAGSALTLDRAVANAVALGLDLVDAVAAASTLPADLVGEPDRGRLRPGARADLVWLGDDLRARATWVCGRLAHGPDGLDDPSSTSLTVENQP